MFSRYSHDFMISKINLISLILFGALFVGTPVRASPVLEYGIGSIGASSLQRARESVTFFPHVHGLVANPAQLAKVQSPYVNFGFLGTFGLFNPIRNFKMNDSTYVPQVITKYDETLGGLLYNRSKRVSLMSSVGIEVLRGLYVGAGLNTFIKASAATAMDLNQQHSNLALVMSVKPAMSPFVNLFYEQERFSLSFGYRAESNTEVDFNNIKATLGTNVNGKTVSVELPMAFYGSAFYDPAQWEATLAFPLTKDTVLAATGTFQQWSKHPFRSFKNPLKDEILEIPYSDTWTAQIGVAQRLGRLNFGGDYSYVPTPLPAEKSLSVGFLDSDKHVFSLRAGYELKSFLDFLPNPFQVNVQMQYHSLEEKSASGYNFEGKVGGAFLTYGMNITMKL
ncbi:MAG: hypothetical protein HYS98_02260 [Deltaproteobacteria bacterium]|nr:hypothetical protein [Deltaproteobacteria bacterium]